MSQHACGVQEKYMQSWQPLPGTHVGFGLEVLGILFYYMCCDTRIMLSSPSYVSYNGWQEVQHWCMRISRPEPAILADLVNAIKACKPIGDHRGSEAVARTGGQTLPVAAFVASRCELPTSADQQLTSIRSRSLGTCKIYCTYRGTVTGLMYIYMMVYHTYIPYIP